MQPVRWGFLGSGWLVNARTADALHQAAGAELTACGARDIERALRANPIRAYGSYQEVIDDPDIEAVYIALANDVHLHWILAALEAGKHVLCEKPMTLSAADTQTAFDAAEKAGLLLVEAVWTRWHPRMQRIATLASSGALGTITDVTSSFTWESSPAALVGNYRFFPEFGGGAFYDVGIYPLNALIACIPNAQDLKVETAEFMLNEHGADLTAIVNLTWNAGSSHAKVTASFAMPESQELTIVGQHGVIRIPDSDAHASWKEATRLAYGENLESFDVVDAYQLMFEAMSSRIRGGDNWILPAQDSISVAMLVDQAIALRP
jgi:xylose dehydrogenase (NAD/NADP)